MKKNLIRHAQHETCSTRFLLCTGKNVLENLSPHSRMCHKQAVIYIMTHGQMHSYGNVFMTSYLHNIMFVHISLVGG